MEETNRPIKLGLLSDGLTSAIIKERVNMAGKWMMLQAKHQSDYSRLTLPADVDYKNCLYHEVLKAGPGVTEYKPGDWVVVIKNALDGLTSNYEFVACLEEDAIMKVDTSC